MERENLRQIWPIFSAEAREHLQAISSGILELERDPASPVLDAILRTAHSLKGSAGSLGLSDVETLAHALEGRLDVPREGLTPTASGPFVWIAPDRLALLDLRKLGAPAGGRG